MKRVCFALLLVFRFSSLASAQVTEDALDLHRVTVHASPPNIADWARTVSITALTMDPRGGVALTFDRPLPDAWKWGSNPRNPAENFQFTVWMIVQNQTAGFVQMWQGRSMTDGSIPAPMGGYQVLWGSQGGSTTGVFRNYVPKAGDLVGYFVSAGNGRGVTTVTSVQERSNVVLIALPANDIGVFTFTGFPPVAPNYGAQLADLQAQINDVNKRLAFDATILTSLTDKLDNVADVVAGLKTLTARLIARPVVASCAASIAGIPIHCRIQNFSQ